MTQKNNPPIEIRIAPERNAPQKLNIQAFSEWFQKELKEDNIEIPEGNSFIVVKTAYRKYMQCKSLSPSQMPQAFQIAMEIMKKKLVEVYRCKSCNHLLLGVTFPCDNKGYIYCDSCAKKHLAKCRSCNMTYRKSDMIKLKDNSFICRACQKNLQKAIEILKQQKKLFK